MINQNIEQHLKDFDEIYPHLFFKDSVISENRREEIKNFLIDSIRSSVKEALQEAERKIEEMKHKRADFLNTSDQLFFSSGYNSGLRDVSCLLKNLIQ